MTKVKKGLQSFGLPRIIITTFFLVLLILAAVWDMNVPNLMSNTLRRWAMNGVLVLAMVPAIKCGIGPNFGVTIGIVGGLLGALISIEMRSAGIISGPWVGVTAALVLAIIISGMFGVFYGLLLNRVKGSEMTVSTYVGFSIIAFMNIMWLWLPFKSRTSIWALGGVGLRNTINLEDDFREIFNNISFRIPIGAQGIEVPIGTILVFFFFCLLMWLFTRSRLGMMMSAAGTNPVYAKASGINVNAMRVLGTAISTALGGVGIVLYAQSYGFLQMYNGPLMMGFQCVAAVLIGGATIHKAGVFNAILGTFLFHGILAVALPVANELAPEGNLSDVFRIIISNGIILYALSKAKEASR